MTHLFYNWKFVPFNLLYPFHSLPPTPCLCQPPICPLYLWAWWSGGRSCLFVCLFFKISHISEIIRYLSFSVWFILLISIIPSTIHVVANGKISFFIMTQLYSIVCLYIHTTFFFGCVGSVLLRAAFSSCGEWGLCFIAVRGLLIAVASLVAEHGSRHMGFSSYGWRALECRLSRCGARA